MPIKFRDANDTSRVFKRRARLAAWIACLFTLLLLSHFIYLQVIQHDRYATLSLQNQMNFIPIDPNRGLIYDRHGVLLAKNEPTYSLTVIPAHVSNLKETLNNLKSLVVITDNDLKYFYRQTKRHRRFEASTLRLRLTEKEMSAFSINQHRFPGVSIHAQLTRYYPLKAITAHVVGHVGRINESELKKVDAKNYHATQYIGKLGIEKKYESLLHGTVGYDQIETDARGRIVRTVQRIPPIAGSDIYLTIDTGLTQAAMTALNKEHGAVVAIDPRTGELLTLVSQPSFDPNLFVKGLSQVDVKTMHQNPDRPLHNRALRGLYPPGSTIKPFVGLAALESQVLSPHFSIHDPGFFKVPHSQHIYRDWIYSRKQHGHGVVDLKRAIAVSCDTFFYQLGVRFGIQRLAPIFQQFGFGQISGLDLPGELAGSVPDPKWKKQYRKESWYPGDTVNTSIGQGFFLTTPLQLAVATATFAMRGVNHPPHALAAIQAHDAAKPKPFQHEKKPKQTIFAKPEFWHYIVEAMASVVKGEGTGRARFGEPIHYTVAAKTGTAQVFSFGKKKPRRSEELPYHLRDNTLFIAFAPIDNPKIALAILVEHSTRAPQIARQILDHFFGVNKPIQLEENTEDPSTLETEEEVPDEATAEIQASEVETEEDTESDTEEDEEDNENDTEDNSPLSKLAFVREREGSRVHRNSVHPSDLKDSSTDPTKPVVAQGAFRKRATA